MVYAKVPRSLKQYWREKKTSRLHLEIYQSMKSNMDKGLSTMGIITLSKKKYTWKFAWLLGSLFNAFQKGLLIYAFQIVQHKYMRAALLAFIISFLIKELF